MGWIGRIQIATSRKYNRGCFSETRSLRWQRMISVFVAQIISLHCPCVQFILTHVFVLYFLQPRQSKQTISVGHQLGAIQLIRHV